MPDVHLGIGATVGSVIPTKRAIIPAAVGVDIGCGMMAARTVAHRRTSWTRRALKKVFDQITRDVPVGFEQHDERDARTHAAKPFQKDAAADPRASIRGIEKRIGKQLELGAPARHARRRQPLHRGVPRRGEPRVGDAALGQPRHRQRDRHATSSSSPSRTRSETSSQLPDRDLAYFPEGAQHFDDYVEAVGWAQDYARANREEMMDLVLDAHAPAPAAVRGHRRGGQLPPQLRRARAATTASDVWVTRKGAIRAGAGELGIIPGSMGARSYIVRGKGSAESFHSCAHGAGRAHEPQRRAEAVSRRRI